MTHHEGHFEMLTALAVAGQLAEVELLELEQHAAQCLSCAQRRAEMEAASRQLFLLNALTTKVSSTPVGMQERFLMRAIDAGVPLNQPTVAHRYANIFRLAPVAVALILILSAGWNAVFETSSTVARHFVSAPNASAPIPSDPVTSAADGNGNNLLTIRHLGKKQPLSKRPAQIQSPTYGSSVASRPNEKRFFNLNRAFSLGTATTLGTVDGTPTFAPAYFISGYDRQRKLHLSSFSALTLWRVSEQKESKKRVFDFSATLAPLSLLSYQPDFRPKSSAPDLSIHDALDPTRFR
jgi:hypothetical protein